MRSRHALRIRLSVIAASAVVALGIAACGEEDLGAAPDVRGLSLPSAKEQLKQGGFSSSVTSDGALGVIVEENWTVCKQKTPVGKLVPLEVSKSC